MASAVLTWAEKRLWLAKGPVVPLQETEETRIHFMTETQEKLLVTYFTNKGILDAATTVRVLCASGLRWGEFEGLDRHMVQVSTRANGVPVAWIKLDRTKTNSPRDVAIPVQLAGELTALLTHGPAPKYSRFRMQFDQAKKMLGLEPNLTIHGMRHATATRLTKKGAQPAKIQQYMGHKAYSTTLKYTHVESEDIAQLSELLDPLHGQNDHTSTDNEVLAFQKSF